MPTPTYDLIATTTLGTAVGTVEFTSISGSYRDLVLVASGVITDGYAPDWELTLNNDTTTANYTAVKMYGNGTTASSGTFTPRVVGLAQSTSSLIMQFLDYSATDKHKTILSRSATNGSSWGVGAVLTRWANTSAITTIKLSTGVYFSTNHTYSLYGIVS